MDEFMMMAICERRVTRRPLLVTMTCGAGVAGLTLAVGSTTAVRTSLPSSTTTIRRVRVGEPVLESVIVPVQSALMV